MTSLRITEIFCSIQGESTTAGEPTVFVRLTGCPLRCHYCDTAYAFSGGEKIAIPEIVDKVAEFGVKFVTVTGGEPLAQQECHALLVALCDAEFKVSLETSGALPIENVDPRVRTILDLKTPGSGEEQKNLLSNIEHLKPVDEIKFVICDRDDYDYALNAISKNRLTDKCQILFSPSYQQLDPKQLGQWMLEDKAPARLQLQMHKYLWGDEPGR